MEEETFSKACSQSSFAFEEPYSIQSASNAVHAAITPLVQRQPAQDIFPLQQVASSRPHHVLWGPALRKDLLGHSLSDPATVSRH